MPELPEWRRFAVEQRSRTGCIPTGYEMLIRAADSREAFRVISSITLTRRVRVLRSTTKGRHDLAVWVQGGGIQPGYDVRLRFNGKTYPSNPTASPAERATNLQADVLFSVSEDGQLLF